MEQRKQFHIHHSILNASRVGKLGKLFQSTKSNETGLGRAIDSTALLSGVSLYEIF